MFAVAFGARLDFIRNQPRVGPVFFGLHKHLFSIVAGHTANGDFVSREHDVRRRPVSARRPRFVRNVSVALAMALCAAHTGAGVLQRQLLGDEVQVTDLAPAVVGHAFNVQVVNVAVVQQKRFCTGLAAWFLGGLHFVRGAGLGL